METSECDCQIPIVKPRTEAHKQAKCPSLVFPYQPLPSPTAIRLLKLSSSAVATHRCEEDLFDSFSCSLVIKDLTDGNCPKYAALSYTWGDPKIYYSERGGIIPPEDWYCQCYHINIDGAPVSVSANLYAALGAIKHVKTRPKHSQHGTIQDDLSYIWIDALCINQSDLEEKSRQVQLMRRIYSHSKHVFVWLGGTDSSAPTAISLLHELARLGQQARDAHGKYPKLALLPEMQIDDARFYDILDIGGHVSIRQWAYIFAFLNRSWFRRVWIIQELGLAKKATILCGTILFDDAALRMWITFLKDMHILSKLEDLEPLIIAGRQLNDKQRERRSRWPQEPEAYTLYKSQDVNRYDSSMFLYMDFVRHLLNTGGRRIPLSQCLLLFRSTEATDPRDKIFGLLGLSSEHSEMPGSIQQRLLPDYNSTAQEVYLKWSEHMIREDRQLAVLSMVEDPSLRKMKDLPSWVPDFSTECRPIPFRMPDRIPFQAQLGLGPMHVAFPEPGVLEVRGYRLNKVSASTKVSDLEEAGIVAIAKFLQAVPRVMMIKKPPEECRAAGSPSSPLYVEDFTPQSRLEIYWRTLITDRLGDKHPAPAECGVATKISFRRTISQSAAKLTTDLTSAEDFAARWEEFQLLNLAFESILIPDEMTSLRQQLEGFEKPATVVAEGEDKASHRIIMLDGGDFGSSIPTEWLDLGENLPWSAGTEADYMQQKRQRLENRKLVIISPGGLGLAPDSVEIDDEVWILAGSQVPFVLRPLDGGRYRLIGEAYVHGVMHGEGAEGVNLTAMIQDICLV